MRAHVHTADATLSVRAFDKETCANNNDSAAFALQEYVANDSSSVVETSVFEGIFSPSHFLMTLAAIHRVIMCPTEETS